MIKLVGSTVLALAVVACSNMKGNTPVASLPLTSAQGVAGAMGNVTVNADTTAGNTKLDVKVEHLAPPAKITPTANVFVVWARAQKEQPQNLGALEVDRDLKGELQTLTTLKNFELFITPEASSSVSGPTNAPVLSTHVNAP